MFYKDLMTAEGKSGIFNVKTGQEVLANSRIMEEHVARWESLGVERGAVYQAKAEEARFQKQKALDEEQE
eukprot:260355-Lingulodinium_polyedra.AAC.1